MSNVTGQFHASKRSRFERCSACWVDEEVSSYHSNPHEQISMTPTAAINLYVWYYIRWECTIPTFSYI
jgi:hypothetical protein